jgi:hypothetical protein
LKFELKPVYCEGNKQILPNEVAKMEFAKLVELARNIVELDVRRDEMYEELMTSSGNRGDELLRAVQNGKWMNKEGS